MPGILLRPPGRYTFTVFGPQPALRCLAVVLALSALPYCQSYLSASKVPKLISSSYSMPSYLNAQKNLINIEKGKRKQSTQLMQLNTKEMPCEVDLGDDFTFHNIFICPVSKETCNPQSSNYPMLLKCGHVISKVSLTKMTRGNSK